jgi:hypothetical protein
MVQWHRTSSLARERFWSLMAGKIAITLAIALAAGLLWAQAPGTPSADTAPQEQTDAQGYKYQVPTESLKKKADEQRHRNAVRSIWNNPAQGALSNPAVRLNFRQYFLNYLFPVMTTEEGLKTIATDRQRFFLDLIGAKNTEAHRELVDLTFQAMSRIVADDGYRLAARYNAMLIISQLNDVEPVTTGSNPTVPEPMRNALQFILDQFRKEDNPDPIRLAALLGLARHLECDNYRDIQPSPPIPPARKAEIIKELIALAEAKDLPEGRDSEVHKWFRRRAIEALAIACSKKSDASVVASIEGLVKDESQPQAIRFAAAAAMGKMSLAAPVKIDPLATAKEIGYLALLACETELTKANNTRKSELERDARLTGNYSGEASYGSGGMPGSPGTYGGAGPGLSGEGGYGAGMARPLRPTPGMGTDGGTGSAYGGGTYGGEAGVMDPSQLDPKHYRVDYLRRKIRQELYAVQLGLTGGEDFAPPRSSGKATPTNPTNAPGGSGNTANAAAEKRGVMAIAKAGAEQDEIKKLYLLVRKLVEAVEFGGPETDFFQLDKDVRKDMKLLEAYIGRRVPPPAAATTTVAASAPDDAPAPSAGKAKSKAGPVSKGGKALPGKATMPKGKTTLRSAPRPAPSVYARPGFGS